MLELLRTNDDVLLSLVEVLLRDACISMIVADQNMSVLEGSLNVLPRRVLVHDDDLNKAKRILQDAGLGHWIKLNDDPFG